MGAQDGMSVLITGGSDGIGRAAATRLVAEGARVVVCGRDQRRLDAAVEHIDPAATGRAHGVQADCRDVEQLRALHAAAVELMGPVTALVNNVGTSVRGPFLELSDEQWMEDIELKLFAAIRLTRMVVPGMIDRGNGGRVVNVLSIGGKHPGPQSAPTTVTRAAGLALTKVLSKELAAHRILVNALCIGTIKSGQHDRRWEQRGGEREDFYEELAAQRGIPIGRVGEAEEVAALINFLLSDEGSYVTGTAINIDGGTSSSL